MSSDPIKSLAVYMTGSRVGLKSIDLQMPALRRADAEGFFALREAFGVSGYATADEAEAAIRRTLKLEAAQDVKWERFANGQLKPFLPPERYDELRNDDRFLYNRGPKPEGLI